MLFFIDFIYSHADMQYKQISVIDAKQLLEKTLTVLVDIRDRESFDNGHAENAIHLSQDILPMFLRDTEKTIPVLVMCYHGNSSQMFAQYLFGQGFLDVYGVIGGYEAWEQVDKYID